MFTEQPIRAEKLSHGRESNHSIGHTGRISQIEGEDISGEQPEQKMEPIGGMNQKARDVSSCGMNQVNRCNTIVE